MVGMVGWLLVWLQTAQAQDPAPTGLEINRLADIYAALPPPGAKKWEPSKLVAAVEASTMRFSPRHVYELIDKEVPQPVIKAVANKVGLFYDGSQLPLHVQAANARSGAPATTVEVSDADAGAMFDWFTAVFKDMDSAEEKLGVPATKGANETDALYEKRERAWEEDRVRQLGPHEGKIQAASFHLVLSATVQNVDGCDRPVASLDASSVDFDLFRRVAGTRLSDTPVQLASHSVDRMLFSVAPQRRVWAMGRCGARSAKLDVTMKRSAEGAWTAAGDFK